MTDLKITKIECTPVKFPLKHFCQGDTAIQKDYRMGYGVVPMALPVVILQLHTDEGITGIGDFVFSKEDIMRDKILIEITDRYEKWKSENSKL